MFRVVLPLNLTTFLEEVHFRKPVEIKKKKIKETELASTQDFETSNLRSASVDQKLHQVIENTAKTCLTSKIPHRNSFRTRV